MDADDHVGVLQIAPSHVHRCCPRFLSEAVVEGQSSRNRRELNVGSFLAAEVWRLGRNVTALELGCGNGQLSYSLNTIPGIRCIGLDGYKAIRNLGSNYRQWDLQTFFPMEEVDFTLSFEIGEHIAPEAEESFLGTLRQAREGIVLAWATPGQAGHGHVNGRWQRYLIRELEKGHTRYCLALSHQLAQGMSAGFHALWEYRNLMVFVAKDSPHVCDLPTRDLAATLIAFLAAVGAAATAAIALQSPGALSADPRALNAASASGLRASCGRMLRTLRLSWLSGKVSTV
ncbi:unnamed protein product [Symbiodinium microadriaticum]|nr:unnamed protein product [Symbiodinium microadriaticum]